MPAAYRSARQHHFLWIGIGLAGVLAQILLMVGLDALGWADRWGVAVFLFSCLPFLAAIGFGWWLLAKFNRERVGLVGAFLESQGFLVSLHPQPETKAGFYPSLAGVLASWGADQGPERIQWIALAEPAERRMAVMEYIYFTGSGKTLQEHAFTVLAWPSAHPEFPALLAQAPSVMLWRMPRWARGWLRRKEELRLPGLEAFQKEWEVRGDAATAQRVLTPAVRSVLEHSPRHECWHLGRGWACACHRSTLDATHLRRFLDHARRVLRSLG